MPLMSFISPEYIPLKERVCLKYAFKKVFVQIYIHIYTYVNIYTFKHGYCYSAGRQHFVLAFLFWIKYPFPPSLVKSDHSYCTWASRLDKRSQCYESFIQNLSLHRFAPDILSTLKTHVIITLILSPSALLGAPSLQGLQLIKRPPYFDMPLMLSSKVSLISKFCSTLSPLTLISLRN